MKKCISRGFALAAIAGLVLAVRAQDTIDQAQFPTILQQPVDQCLPVGAAVTFSVQASNVDSYQWYCSGAALDGQTNSSLSIASVAISNVGYYFVSVIKGSEVVPSRSACLNVYITSAPTPPAAGPGFKSASMNMSMQSFDLGSGGPITVFGAPVVSGGGSGTCPGKFAGYVNYTKTVSQGWGWAPSTNTTIHTATDTNRADTKIQYCGGYGDAGCNQTTVAVPDPAPSPVYRFSIYFPTNTAVPTNAYPITLSGFDQ
jgi:hypothetical protein